MDECTLPRNECFHKSWGRKLPYFVEQRLTPSLLWTSHRRWYVVKREKTRYENATNWEILARKYPDVLVPDYNTLKEIYEFEFSPQSGEETPVKQIKYVTVRRDNFETLVARSRARGLELHSLAKKVQRQKVELTQVYKKMHYYKTLIAELEDGRRALLSK